jgi:hypothetical protein
MSASLLSDAGASIQRTRIGPHIAAENHYNVFHKFTLDCEIAAGYPAAAFTLNCSNDGGQTYSLNAGMVTAPTTNGGGQRIIWRRLGKSRDRVFRVDSNSSTVPQRWINAFIEMTPGNA